MLERKELDEFFSSYEKGSISTEDLYSKLNEFKTEEIQKSELSQGQKGIWVEQKMEEESTAYNIPICFELEEKTDVLLIQQAAEYIWNQYPILKSVTKEEGDKLYQVTDTAAPLPFQIIQMMDKSRAEVIEYAKQLAYRTFDLEKGPLFQIVILEGKTSQLVLMNLHHIICDGTSSVILTQEFLTALHKLSAGEKLFPKKSESSYADFVKWERNMLEGPRGKAYRDFWKEQLENPLPVIELPSDAAGNKEKKVIANMFNLSLGSQAKTEIENFTKKYRISMPCFFLSVLNIFLYQSTNQNDVIVGMATMGRPTEQFESLIGYFINILPIRSKILGSQEYLDYVKELQLHLMDCMDCSDYPYSMIAKDNKQENRGSNAPIFNIAYYYQNFLKSEFMSNMTSYESQYHVKFMNEIHQVGEYDFVLEIVEQKNDVLLTIKYNEALYSKELIEYFGGNMVHLAKKIVEEPTMPIEKLPVLSEEAEKKILYDWNATDIDYPNFKMVHELVKQQANKHPDRIAVIYEDKQLTYRELDEQSDQLALYLQSIGVEPDVLVGICVERSLDMIVGLLGILKAGGAYVPLDPEYPDERIEYMIENSNIFIVLTQSEIISQKSYFKREGMQAILMDKDLDKIHVEGELAHKVQKHNLAYVLYTSGSTGKPKGVMIPHQALTNFLLQMADKPGFTSQDTLLAVTTFCFDISGLELYLPLITGAKYYICSTEKKKDIEKLKLEIKKRKPTVMQATPATWMALYVVGWKNEEHVKVLCGGEALPEKLKKYFLESNTEVWNMFGPTETTIWSTMKKVEADEETTIGTPMANTQVYILDENNKPVPVGAEGELYIAGLGLARGYYNRDDLTQERFVPNPFIEGTKMYKTGDVAKWCMNGEINFIGRADSQVKIHGFRIELSEIETRMNECAQVEQSAVIVAERDGNKQLKAFFVAKDKTRPVDMKQIRSYLKSSLPVYMVPGLIVQIDKLPLTPNGKINRLELAKYKEVVKEQEVAEQKAAEQEVKVQEVKEKKAQTGMEEEQIESSILQIWKDVIGNDIISMEDGFFEVGGDSILAVMIVDKVKKKYSCDVKVTNLFEYSSVKKFSDFVISKLKEEGKIQIGMEKPIDEEVKNTGSEKDDIYADSIAIIGISCQMPGANNKEEFWDNLIHGRDCSKRFSKEQLQDMNLNSKLLNNKRFVPVSMEIEGKEFFDNEFFNISPKDAEYMNPQMRLLLENAWKAVEDAGYVSTDIPNTGVFMSSSNNSYLVAGGMQNSGIIDSSDSYVKWLMSQAGTVPTMVSYRLGFTGPSYALHSNCSSALVGLSSAYQCICSGETDYALVGASTIHSKENPGYMYVPGMNFSKEGHIRAFDENSDGMIGGEGVAVILVKNAKKAIEDNDSIYAILKGISVSNDGTEKVGFYAPSIIGQSNAIEKTLVATGIDPKTISYVETHGTGTKLGDPIEFTALKKVYEKYTDKKQFCGIGSVKTNIGHLDTVAGLAGCIKLALSLKNKKIPQTINYNKPNPEINFEDSPFYMADKTLDLTESEQPARVALSSFGIGGTNVHAIFEEYKGEGHDKLSASSQCLVPLSAKNGTVLKEYAQNLYSYLTKSKDKNLSLADIAYTLQTGRKPMSSRILFYANSVEQLIDELSKYLNQPGYISKKGENELADLWLEGNAANWNKLYTDENRPRRISLPTYPFEKKVFWHEEEENGTVVSSGAVKADKVHYLVDSNISVFGKQQYKTTFTGQEFFLKDHIINKEEVLPGVIYIEMARACGANALRRKITKIKNVVWPRPIVVSKPCDVYVNLENPRGNQVLYQVVTMEQNKAIVHSQGKLEYQNEVANVANQYQEVFDVEGLIRKCDGSVTREEFYHSSMSSVYQYGNTFQPIHKMYFNQTDSIAYLEVPAERYADFDRFEIHPTILEGCLQTITGLLYRGDQTPFMPYTIEEIEVYKKFPKKCISHATFSKQQSGQGQFKKFNIHLYDTNGVLLAVIRNYTIREIVPADNSVKGSGDGLKLNMYNYEWAKREKAGLHADLIKFDSLLVIEDGEQVADQLRGVGKLVCVKQGNTLSETGANVFQADLYDENQVSSLFHELKKRGSLPEKIVYCWSNSMGNDEKRKFRTGLYPLLHIARGLAKLKLQEKVTLIYLYKENNEYETLMNDSLSGFTRTLKIEQPNLTFRLVKLDDTKRLLREIIVTELLGNDSDEVLVKGDSRYIKQLVRTENIDGKKTIPYKERGTYLITGGMGKIGLLIANYLVSKFKANLILTGRAPVTKEKETLLNQLNASEGNVTYVRADMSKQEDVLRLKKQLTDQKIMLQGIFCCAGVIHDSYIVNKSKSQMEEVLKAKIDATILLDEAFKEEKLDFMVLFSSVSHLGNIGQSDYAVANSFLNQFSKYRQKLQREHKRYGKTVSINWPIWENGGMQLDKRVIERQTEKNGIYPMTNEAGLNAIQDSLNQSYDTCIAVYGQTKKIDTFIEKINGRYEKMQEEYNYGSTEDKKGIISEYLLEFLKKTAEELVKAVDIDVDKDMESYGFDSISQTEFTNAINDNYDIEIMPTVFFEIEQPTIRSLGEYLLDKYYEPILGSYGDVTIETESIWQEPSSVEEPKYSVEVPKTAGNNIKEQVMQQVILMASELQKIENIDIDKELESYGFDSISNTELCNMLNDYYDIECMPTIFFELEVPTLRGLVDTIYQQFEDVFKECYQNKSEYVSEQIMEKLEQEDTFSTMEQWNQESEPAPTYEWSKKTEVNYQTEKVIGEDTEDAVAIIGVSGVFPQSENLEEFWSNLKKGESLIGEIPKDRFDWTEFDDPCMRWGAFMKQVDMFDAEFFGMTQQEAEVLDPQHRLFMQTTWNTIQDAGYKPSSLAGTDTGIFVGICTQDYTQIVEDNLTEFNPYALTGRSPFMMPNRISSMLNLHGPSEAIDTACSSSLVAIHKAAEAVRMGTCHMAIAGGVNVILSPLVHKAFSSAGMLSKTGKCNVFDKDADGTIRGEGVGAILLKKLSEAKRDGDHIYALIRNSGENHKGKSASLTAPNANAEKELIVNVYNGAHIDPSTVNYIEVHSTGTKLGDPVEITGLKNAFAQLAKENNIELKANSCAISSIKPVIGHLEAAAGIASVIKILLSLKHNEILKVSNFKELNPYISLEQCPLYINQSNQEWKPVSKGVPRRAGVSAFGYGGVNAHLLIEEYMDTPVTSTYEPEEYMIVFSGKSKEALVKQAEGLRRKIEKNNWGDDKLLDIAYTLQTGRELYSERVGFIVCSTDELMKCLSQFIDTGNINGRQIVQGTANGSAPILSILNKSDVMDDLIKSFVHRKQYSKILELWANGIAFDFEDIYIGRNVRKISLPAYPFDEKRHWVQLKERHDETAKKDTDKKDIAKQESTSDIVLDVLSQMLGIKKEEIDVKCSASDMGVDSIVLMQLLRKIQLINPDVDFELLYCCETIQDILDTVKQDKEEVTDKKSEETDANKIMALVYGNGGISNENKILLQYPELIKLNQSKEGRPVFWLHGGFGGVEIYRLIANTFERPFYGIQAKGYMTEEEPEEGIEAMASYYVEIIESIQPQGPYDLGGLSLGGIIAYEVCRQLQMKGHKVNTIVMLESIFVDEAMRQEWSNMSTVNLKKDQMFRACNLLLAFNTEKELKLITEDELKPNVSDEEFLLQLVEVSGKHGMKKPTEQLKKLILNFQKTLYALDYSTTYYEAEKLNNANDVKCYYFCNPNGTLFGNEEEYFRLVDKGRAYDFAYFADAWKEKMPSLEMIEVSSSSHMTILTEESSRAKILDLCNSIYRNK